MGSVGTCKMFSPSKNITRSEALGSIVRRFALQNDAGLRLLNYFYPAAFWRVLSVDEYQELVKQLLRPTDKKIINILGENRP